MVETRRRRQPYGHLGSAGLTSRRATPRRGHPWCRTGSRRLSDARAHGDRSLAHSRLHLSFAVGAGRCCSVQRASTPARRLSEGVTGQASRPTDPIRLLPSFARLGPQEGGENGAGDGQRLDPTRPAPTAWPSAISSCGCSASTPAAAPPGPTHFNDNLVTVVVQDLLTKGERSLIRDGKADLVLETRRAYQVTMRDDLPPRRRDHRRQVIAFLSANQSTPTSPSRASCSTLPIRTGRGPAAAEPRSRGPPAPAQ